VKVDLSFPSGVVSVNWILLNSILSILSELVLFSSNLVSEFVSISGVLMSNVKLIFIADGITVIVS